MADQDVNIRVNTSANTKGLRDASRSVEQLERELRDARKAFRDAKTGSEEFTASARKIAALRAEIAKVGTETKKLGRRGNAGMAVLEMSRMYEDAQYGIRGVLNNIPGLVAMLGGGAGLAGAISLAAVGASQLWSRMTAGAENSKQALQEHEKAMEKAMEAYKSQMEKQSEERKKRTSKDAQELKEEMEDHSDATSEGIFNINLAAAIEKGTQLLQMANDRIEVAKLEKLIAEETGETAVKLAKRREAIVLRIAETERGMRDAARKQALAAAQLEESQAQETFFSTQDASVKAQMELAMMQGPRNQDRERLAAMRAEREAKIAANKRRLASINANIDANRGSGYSPTMVNQADVAEGMRLKKEIESLSRETGAEKVLRGEIRQQSEQIKKFLSELSELEEQTRLAGEAFKAATTQVERLEQMQAVERRNELGQDLSRQNQTAGGLMMAARDLLQGQTGAGIPGPIKAGVERLGQMLGDDTADAQQVESIVGILQSVENNTLNKDQAFETGLKQLIEQAKTQAKQTGDTLRALEQVKRLAEQNERRISQMQ